jgi:hypothetical protein
MNGIHEVTGSIPVWSTKHSQLEFQQQLMAVPPATRAVVSSAVTP